MPLYEIPNMTNGTDQLLIGTMAQVPSLVPMFLLFIFGVVFLGGIANEKRRTGTADFPMWGTVAALSVLMITLPLTLTGGLIQLEVLAIIVALVIMMGLWLFLTRNRNEV